jgi:glycerol-3-phosphate acyltransferase PlsY
MTMDFLALPPFVLAGSLAIGYLLGSIPFGLIVTRLAGTGDIRQIGSGNIGATNVLRTGRKGLAAVTLIGDMLKGTAAVLIVAMLWGRDAALLAGFGAIVGHMFPVWLGFRGGKGVATYIGVLLGLFWPAVLAFAVIWGAVAGLTRYSSLAGLVATALMPVVLWWTGDNRAAILMLVLAVMVWIMHRGNIARLVDGTEGKIGKKAEAAPPG